MAVASPSTGPAHADDGVQAPAKPAGLTVDAEQGSLDVSVLWDDKPRDIEADATGSTPSMGMLLLDRPNLNMEVESRGRIVIEARA